MRHVSLSLLIGLTGCSVPWHDGQTLRIPTTTLPVQGHVHVHVTADDGSVRVSSADIAQVEMEIVASGYDLQRDLEISMTPHGDRVDIVAKTRSHWEFFNVTRRSLHVEVRIPRDADVQVSTGDGSVEANAIAGGLDVRTGDGNVDVNQASGSIKLHTGDGSIEARELDGMVNASTGDGNVRLDGRFDALAVSTGDGNLVARAAVGSRMLQPWQLDTGDGNVHLGIPADLQAHVDARSHDGGVHSSFPLHHGSSRVHGDLNGGGPAITVRTGDGSIHLDAI
jgi:DUF4097 and DUF4098 domain-containing protein YvlB